MIFSLKKHFTFLIIVFLFSKMKADSYGSAFSDMSKFFQNDSITMELSEKKNRQAKKLLEDGNYSESLKIAYSLLSLDNFNIKIKANYLLGKNYEKNKDVNSAIKHLKESLSLMDENSLNLRDIGNFDSELTIVKAEILLLLGKIYMDKYLKYRKIDSSSYFLNRLLKIQSFDDKMFSFKARAYNNLSINAGIRKEYKRAEQYSFKSIKILEGGEEKEELPASYINLANIYEVTNERDKALQFYFKALSCVEDKTNLKSVEYKETLYYNIAWTMYKLKDYKAYEYLDKSYTLKDSLINIGLRKELKKIEQIHNIDIIRKEEENKRSSLIRNNWFIGVIGLSLSLLFLYIANLQKLKQKDLKLKLTLKGFEQQKKINDIQLESQAKIINATIDGKESERKQIAETLHDNVSALLSSANMHLQASQKYFGSNPPIELEKTQKIITEASQQIRDLSHNLMSSVLLKFGIEYAVKDVANKYSNSTIKLHTVIEKVDRYSQDFEIRVFNIIQELINNVLKHSKASKAFIALEGENEQLLIIVKDNGVGFTNKTEQEKGIGLTQIEARVSIMNGVFNVVSSKDNGTKITLKIPVVKRKNTTLV